MALQDSVFPQSGDPNDMERFAQMIGQDSLVDHVEFGMTFTADWANDSLDVSEGLCYIGFDSERPSASDALPIKSMGYAVQCASRTLTLPSDGVHDIVVEANLDSTDNPYVDLYSDPTNASVPYLIIGTVDVDAQTVTEKARDPNPSKADVTHDNSAHNPNFLETANYTPVTDVDAVIDQAANSVDGLDIAVNNLSSDKADIPHDNTAHDPNFLVQSNYTPVADVDAEVTDAATTVSGLDTTVFNMQSGKADNPHDNGQHSTNFSPQGHDHNGETIVPNGSIVSNKHVIPVQSSDPSSPDEGQIWVRDDL